MKTDDIESQLADRDLHVEDSCVKLASTIRKTFKTGVPSLSSKSCIYRVPDTFCKLNKAAYTPTLVSIGPFHYGKVELQSMEMYKVLCLEKILGRRGASFLEELLIYIKEQENRVRECYAESIELKCDEFVKMILYDASFILELICSRSLIEEVQENERYMIEVQDEIYNVFSKLWRRNHIVNDLKLLENQLPYFLLEELYNMVFPSNRICFFPLVCKFFEFGNNEKVSPPVHFTDLARAFMIPSSPGSSKRGKVHRLSYRAVQLHDLGVKFEAISGKCLFDIEFSNGVLKIPKIQFEDSTESGMRNLIALEQCHIPLETYISDYIILMGTLIDSAKDVELLVQNGIISNCLGGNDALASLINILRTGIPNNPDESCLCGLYENLVEYYRNPRNTWKASLRYHLSTPWRIVSSAAAILLLVLTFLQTVSSFISL